MGTLRAAALLAAIVYLSAGPSAQGLADAARRAAAAAAPAAKKYTNDDVEMAKPAAVPAVTAPAGDGAPSVAPKGDTDKAAPAAEAPEGAKAETVETRKPAPYVVKRIAELKAQIQNLQQSLRDAQSQGDQSDAGILKTRIGHLQKELSVLESRLPPAAESASH